MVSTIFIKSSKQPLCGTVRKWIFANKTFNFYSLDCRQNVYKQNDIVDSVLPPKFSFTLALGQKFTCSNPKSVSKGISKSVQGKKYLMELYAQTKELKY